MRIGSWGIFLFSIIVNIIFSVFKVHPKQITISLMVVRITSFISREILITIMWQLASTKTLRTSDSEDPAVKSLITTLMLNYKRKFGIIS
jgi:hypothetical protein